MAFIEWNEALYSVGVKQFDNEHKELIRLINDLHAAMKAGKGRDLLAKTLGQLTDYVKYHFGAEEAIMRQHAYPGLLGQSRQHDIFTKKVVDYQQKLQAGEVTITVELLNFLQTWLIEHIQKSDREYTTFFHGKGVS